MEGWSKGGTLGSLRKRVARDVRQHRKENTALLSARAPIAMRLLRAIFGERGLLGFLIPYAVIVAVVLIVEAFLIQQWPDLIPPWSNSAHIGPLLREVTSYLLGAQVIMVGLLFPIAVGLVTLIVQREDASSTVSDIQVYYGESLAYRIGASGIALSIVLAVQLVWPVHFALHHLGLGNPSKFFKIALAAGHLVWLVVNFSALWHFLRTSLSFMRPAERALLRRRFAANVSVPQDLTERWTTALYATAGPSLLKQSSTSDGDDDAPSLLFGSDLGDWGEIEIADPALSGKFLYDVWMTPLGWAVRSWWKRCKKHQADALQHHGGPALVFIPDFRRPLPEDGILCRRSHGVPLNALERFLIRRSFRFRKERS